MIGMKLLQLGRRQLHTIISRQLIKPSSSTSSLHHTNYNLSELDQLFHHTYIPLILLYPHNVNNTLTAHEKADVLKRSLSRTLTHYYPFAGRFPTSTKPSYVECNGEGIVFVEAENDSQLAAYQQEHIISKEDETLDQLFADNLVGRNSPKSTNVVGVQLNHFACGGLVVAVSMSHAIGDGSTLGCFVNHWASMARYGSTHHEKDMRNIWIDPALNPHFIHSPRTNSVVPESDVINNQGYNARWVTKKLFFPNSKLSELKNKVIAMAPLIVSDLTINKPTRVEVLSSLLYKTAVTAATKKNGHFESSALLIAVDIRNKFVKKLPQTTVGNLLSAIMVPTMTPNEARLSFLVSELKKQKLQLEGSVESVQHAAENITSLFSKVRSETKRSYTCSSVCGFPFGKVDFGWGKPLGVTFPLSKSAETNGFMLTETPNGDGIEAIVILDEEEMKIFENNKEMLSYNQNRTLVC